MDRALQLAVAAIAEDETPIRDFPVRERYRDDVEVRWERTVNGNWCLTLWSWVSITILPNDHGDG